MSKLVREVALDILLQIEKKSGVQQFVAESNDSTRTA